MKRYLKKGLWISLALITLIGIAFGLNWMNGSVPVDPVPVLIEGIDDPQQENQEIDFKLRSAPWQGLRYISGHNEWRFYGVIGETKQIVMIHPISLVKVYYLQSDGDISFTWVTTEIQFPGEAAVLLAAQPIQEGQLVAVGLKGDYVNQSGVFWEDCVSEYCHLAQMIDTTLVLDEKETGISNSFIRYGWEPPSYPMYGFLCWQIEPVQEFVSNLK